MAERVVDVQEVKAFKTQSGTTRFVLVADDGGEYTTFKEPIAKQAIAAEGRRARIEYHEQERNGFTNVYLDRVEPLEEEPDGGEARVEEVAWRTAVDAAPGSSARRRPAASIPTRRSRSCSRSRSAWPTTSATTTRTRPRASSTGSRRCTRSSR
jgi:hypothetical protein